jgi:hypothetical protein
MNARLEHVLSDLAPVVVLVSVIAIAGAALLHGQSKAKATVWPASDLKWVESTAVKGAAQAVLWGDPNKGAYGVLKRVPNGTVLPMHWHTHTTRVVMVAGTISFALDGSAPRDLPPQSHATIPGGVKHMATCTGGAECVYFETSANAYDVKIVKGTR